MAQMVQEMGVKPELEVFDLGQITLARNLIDDGLIDAPPMFQLCLGIPWGAGADTETMAAMKQALPPGHPLGWFRHIQNANADGCAGCATWRKCTRRTGR